MKLFAAGIGLAIAAAAAPVVFAASAHADPEPNACLVIVNNTPSNVSITVNNPSFAGTNWTVSPWANTILTYHNKAIITTGGDWYINGPNGSWSYDPTLNDSAWGCNGSWVFTIN